MQRNIKVKVRKITAGTLVSRKINEYGPVTCNFQYKSHKLNCPCACRESI